MSPFATRAWTITGAVIAVVLQVVVAPNIQIASAMPNFILVYVVAVAVANGRNVGYVMPFVLGLMYDFIGIGPIGGMAFVCVAATFFASLFFKMFDNETVFIPIVIILAVCPASELAYCLLTIACGLNVSLLEALLYIVLPCNAYDMVLAVITYLVVHRFVFRDKRPAAMSLMDTKIS